MTCLCLSWRASSGCSWGGRTGEGGAGAGAGRRRGREDEDGPSAEADGAEAGRLTKVMRSPPHCGDGGDGLSEDEAMSQD